MAVMVEPPAAAGRLDLAASRLPPSWVDHSRVG